jgi:hypothetical protein
MQWWWGRAGGWLDGCRRNCAARRPLRPAAGRQALWPAGPSPARAGARLQQVVRQRHELVGHVLARDGQPQAREPPAGDGHGGERRVLAALVGEVGRSQVERERAAAQVDAQVADALDDAAVVHAVERVKAAAQRERAAGRHALVAVAPGVLVGGAQVAQVPGHEGDPVDEVEPVGVRVLGHCGGQARVIDTGGARRPCELGQIVQRRLLLVAALLWVPVVLNGSSERRTHWEASAACSRRSPRGGRARGRRRAAARAGRRGDLLRCLTRGPTYSRRCPDTSIAILY